MNSGADFFYTISLYHVTPWLIAHYPVLAASYAMSAAVFVSAADYANPTGLWSDTNRHSTVAFTYLLTYLASHDPGENEIS